MRDASNSSGLAMKPSVVQEQACSDVSVYNGELVLEVDGEVSTETGSVVMTFRRSPQILFTIPKPSNAFLFMAKRVRIGIPGVEELSDVIVRSSHVDFGRRKPKIGQATFSLNDLMVTGSEERMGRVRFHLCNFVSYLGNAISRIDAGKGYWAGRAEFKFGKWRVILDSLRDGSERRVQAQAEGGYAITHVGNLERIDRKLFGVKEAEEALQFLYYVFTFANGSRCPCVLPMGYRHLDREVCRWLLIQKSSCEERSSSWFAEGAPSRSLEFAEGMWTLWKEEADRDWITHAIGLFADSNRNASGVDIELAKSQIALEMLAWVAAQERIQLFSAKGFEAMSAADKIRVALLWAGVPTTIPKGMKDLEQALPQLNLGDQGPFDGPFAVTQLRNAAIHATRAKRLKVNTLSKMARYQAWQLSQDYVCLLLLRLVGYAGPYVPRLRKEDVPRLWHPVPWAPQGE